MTFSCSAVMKPTNSLSNSGPVKCCNLSNSCLRLLRDALGNLHLETCRESGCFVLCFAMIGDKGLPERAHTVAPTLLSSQLTECDFRIVALIASLKKLLVASCQCR